LQTDAGPTMDYFSRLPTSGVDSSSRFSSRALTDTQTQSYKLRCDWWS